MGIRDEDDTYPYCAQHGHSFDNEQGCAECVEKAMKECDDRIAAAMQPTATDELLSREAQVWADETGRN